MEISEKNIISISLIYFRKTYYKIIMINVVVEKLELMKERVSCFLMEQDMQNF